MSQNGVSKNELTALPKSTLFGTRKVLVTYVICWSITLVTMLTSIFTHLFADNTFEKMFEHIGLCVGAFLLLHIPLVMHKRFHFRMPSFIQISIAFLILAHFVLGEIFRFYDHVMLYDKFLHLTGGLTVGACGFSIVYGFSKTDNGSSPINLSPFFAALFSFCFAVAMLAMWEIFEYMVDSIGGFNMQRYKDGLLSEVEYNGATCWITSTKQGIGLKDTMNDLMIGALGALGVSILGWMKFKTDPDTDNHKKFLITRKKPEALS